MSGIATSNGRLLQKGERPGGKLQRKAGKRGGPERVPDDNRRNVVIHNPGELGGLERIQRTRSREALHMPLKGDVRAKRARSQAPWRAAFTSDGRHLPALEKVFLTRRAQVSEWPGLHHSKPKVKKLKRLQSAVSSTGTLVWDPPKQQVTGGNEGSSK